MKKLIMIGRTGCGKTTLTQVLHSEKIDYKKTQAIEFFDKAIDTPGEYIENRRFYNALIVSAADCDIIALLQSSIDEHSIFPPGFATSFAKPVIGIITKADLCHSEEELKRSEKFLKEAGVKQIYTISSIESYGVEDIIKLLE
ncbi:ethanolamine utilization protein EutP [Hathewaya proteolytica DSM 3090]|uniref:Ethanolamine utilization protein EutP n=1 Tax=Hathewaya proteolytica DSM 3090 TaxID=1121331 RepID=A0A1M6KBB6_9CLOT|nr:EutP/PduV family microcompartment system protein [Hathewaya proteolytica]SHJ56210.1 ethanolamine utilization protein EutP [Hathewaya proteolytica DSM 3090]